MFLIVLALTVGILYVAGGIAKLAGVQVMRRDAARFGFDYRAYRLVGAIELLGGAAVALGSLFWPLGAAGAIGLALLMVGAVATHIRVKDPVGKTASAAVFGVLCAVIAYLFVSA